MSEQSPSLERARRQSRRRRWILGSACAAAIVIGGGAVAYRYWSIEKSLGDNKVRAEAILNDASADTTEAVALLRTVVERRPDDVDALSALARAQLRKIEPRRQHVINALRTYAALLDLDPTRDVDRAEMVRLLDLVGDSETLLKYLTPLLASRSKDASLHELNTLHLVRLGRSKDAEKAARDWCDAAPGQFRAHLTYLGQLTANGNDQRAADSYLNSALTKVRQTDGVVLARAMGLLENGKKEDAVGLIDALLARQDWDRTLARPLMLLLDSLGRRADADRVAAEALPTGKDDSLAAAVAQREIDRSNYAAALKSMESAPLPEERSRRAAQLAMATFLSSRMNQPGQAERWSKQLSALPTEYNDPWLAALESLDNNPISFTAARDRLQRLRVSILVDEGGSLLQLATANCLIASDQPKAADRLLASALRAQVGWSLPARRLIELRRGRGELVQAIEVAQFGFDRSGRTIDWAIMLALCVAESKPTGEQATKCLQLLTEIQRAVPGELQTLGAYVEALSKQDVPAATAALREALDRDATIPPETLLSWADISQRNGLGLEQRCLDAASRAGKLSPRLALTRSLIDHRAGRTAEALEALKQLRNQHPQAKREWDESVARFLSEIKSPDAPAAWSALADAFPDDAALQSIVLQLGTEKDPKRILTLVERVRKTDPTNVDAELADIKQSLSIAKGKAELEAALLRLTRVVERAPDSVQSRVLLLDVLLRSGNAKAALAQWEKAVELVPLEPALLIAGAQLLADAGDRGRAMETLDRAQALAPNMNAAQQAAAGSLYLRLGDSQKALSMLQAIQEPSRDVRLQLVESFYRSGNPSGGKAILDELLVEPDLRSLLLASALESAAGQSAQALAHAESALALPTLSVADRLRLADRFTELEQPERAMEAIAGDPSSVELAVRIAKQHLTQRNLDAMEQSLTSALKTVDEPARIQARIGVVPQIRKLVAASLPAVAAAILETPDDPATLQLVDFSLNSQTQPVREQQRSLDTLAEREATSYAAQMFVAERYLAANQPMRAERHARVAATVETSAPMPMALAAIAADRAKNTGRCAEAIRDWRNRLPVNSAQPDVIETRNLVRRREYTELLSRFEQPVVAQPAAVRPEVRMAVALAMFSRGRPADAAALLGPFIAQDSGFTRTWIDLAVSELAPGVARSALDSFATSIDARGDVEEQTLFAIASDRVARRSNDVSQQRAALARLERVEAIGATLPLQALIRLAEYRVERGETALAETMYRSALERDPTLAVVWNNFAFLLSKLGKADESIAAADRALAQRPDSAPVLDTKAAVLLAARRPVDAFAAANKAVETDPLNPKWLLRLGEAQLASGDSASAKTSLETLAWFFREPDAWDAELSTRFKALNESLTRPTTTSQPAKQATHH